MSLLVSTPAFYNLNKEKIGEIFRLGKELKRFGELEDTHNSNTMCMSNRNENDAL